MQKKLFFAVVIFAFQCAKKPHPPQALYVKYRCVGVSPSFNVCVDCSALEKRENLHHENSPLYDISQVNRCLESVIS